MRPLLPLSTLVIAIASASPVHAEPGSDTAAVVRLAAGIDPAYPLGVFGGLSAAGSWKLLTAEVGVAAAPGAEGTARGLHAIIGIRADVVRPRPGVTGWSVGVSGAGGWRYYEREPEESVMAGIHAMVGAVAVEATRWTPSGLGVETRLAALYTVPMAWNEMDFYYHPRTAAGIELSLGVAQRW